MMKRPGLYEQFQTDPTLEIKGVTHEFGNTRITIAYAGGANKEYQRTLERLMQPYRRALQSGMMDNTLAEEILKETYANTIIKNWETYDEESETWKQGIEGPGGDLLPFSPQNVLLTLKNLNWIWLDVQEQATKLTLFRQHQLEEEAKN